MQYMNLSRFEGLWQRNMIQGGSDNSHKVFSIVQHCYQEHHRHYHNDEHINHCLELLEVAKNEMQLSDSIELAIWFHDVIYVVGAADNEERSAELFLKLSDGQLQENLRKHVSSLIMSTIHDDNHPVTNDERILVDIDLSSFGLSWDRFTEDGDNVRKEQSHLSDHDFFKKQMRFQESLLNRARFYFSDFFFEKFEAKARENLSRHLEVLRSKGFFAEI